MLFAERYVPQPHYASPIVHDRFSQSPGHTPFAGSAPQFNWSAQEELQDANSLNAHPDRRQLRLLALRDDSE